MDEATVTRVARRVPFAQFERVEVGFPAGVGKAFLEDGRCLLDGIDRFGGKDKPRCGCTCPDLGANRSPNAINCWSLNYLHMNHFFVHLLWKQPALTEQCDYFMRVDADMYLQRTLTNDPLTQLAPRTAENPTHGRWPKAKGKGDMEEEEVVEKDEEEEEEEEQGECVFLAEKVKAAAAHACPENASSCCCAAAYTLPTPLSPTLLLTNSPNCGRVRANGTVWCWRRKTRT